MSNHPDYSINISGRLRNRLFRLLMIPLIIIAGFVALETFHHSKSLARKSFDKSLIILSLTIIEQSDTFSGDTISENILELITQSMGDVIYYHVKSEDGASVSGYSNAPQPPPELLKQPAGKPYLFNSTYQGEPIRATFMKRYSDDAIYKGWVELIVWQYLTQQHELQSTLFNRTLLQLLGFLVLVGSILWFGINYGLRPLTNLQTAISKRTLDDLNPIVRPVPFEVKELVESMNDLFNRIKNAMSMREAFLANASHQLKTPLTNISGKADLALRAIDPVKKQEHIVDLKSLTSQTSRLTNQMLSLLRADSDELLIRSYKTVDVQQLVRDTCEYYAKSFIKADRELIFDAKESIIIETRLPTMLTECVSNLIENSLAYSNPSSSITIQVLRQGEDVEIRVIDSGPGIPKTLQKKVTQRFYRVPGMKVSGCGLGLAIVVEIMKKINGSLFFEGPEEERFVVGLRLPINKPKD